MVILNCQEGIGLQQLERRREIDQSSDQSTRRKVNVNQLTKPKLWKICLQVFAYDYLCSDMRYVHISKATIPVRSCCISMAIFLLLCSLTYSIHNSHAAASVTANSILRTIMSYFDIEHLNKWRRNNVQQYSCSISVGGGSQPFYRSSGTFRAAKRFHDWQAIQCQLFDRAIRSECTLQISHLCTLQFYRSGSEPWPKGNRDWWLWGGFR